MIQVFLPVVSSPGGELGSRGKEFVFVEALSTQRGTVSGS